MTKFEEQTKFKNAKEIVETKITENNEKIKELLSIENKTYDNFVVPFEIIGEELSIMTTPFFHLDSVKNSEETQEVYSQLLPIISEYSNNIGQNLEIFEVLKLVEKTDNSITDIQKKSLNDHIKGFQLSGCELSQNKKDRLKEISLKLSELSKEFSQNVLDGTNDFELVIDNIKDVEGLPESDLSIAEFEEEGNKKWKFTLQMPSYISYMTYGENRSIREKLYQAHTTRAPQNEKIIEEISLLRKEKSALLGFDNYSQYSLASKSAPSEDKVVLFLEDLGNKSKIKAKEELDIVSEYALKDGIELMPWDLGFYSELIRKEQYDLDEEVYRPYFEQDSVLHGLFDFIEKMWGIKFVQTITDSWDEKVKVFDLLKDGSRISSLHLDLEARDNKRGGAWMNNWHSKLKNQLPSAYVVCNFPPSTENVPSLLRHSDVVTLFHEMGHALHHLLTQVEEPSVGGINVDWDVVEFPSQFLEYFSYEKEVLQTFAKHHETMEVLPTDMIDKLRNARNFHSSLATVRQIEFALFDFKLHQKIHNSEETQELLDNIREEFSPLIPPRYNKFQNSFSHIFAGGYSAGYYSYKWAEVLSAHAFTKYLESQKKEEFATAYNDIINAKGGSEDMEVLFRELTGEDPDVDSLLRIDGII